jgi:AraC family transcriptional regulator of adaptative response / DNA-3-methyladenine glycosylase II
MNTMTGLDADSCYQALASRDARFDGRFYVGVSSTHIYCRVVCPARTPRRDHCTFFPSAAAAERAGYRPCLRCRPELAPGNIYVDTVSRLAAEAASRIEDGILTAAGVDGLAAGLGITARHLRRVVVQEFGVTPIELAQTHRLLLAKRLLTDTDLPVIEVAYASGFASLRRFNALFKERYRLNPTGLRKGQPHQGAQQLLVCDLAYRPPLDWPPLLGFLAARAIAGVEWIDGPRYRRTVAFGEHRGWIAIEPVAERAIVRVAVAPALAPVLPQVLAAVKRLCDLLAPPQQIAAQLGPLAAAHPGLRVPGAFDGFEVGVRAILGQQVSVKAASTLAARFAAAFGAPISTPHPELCVLAPAAERVAAALPEEITALGITRGRAEAILALARSVAAREIVLEPGVDVDGVIARLQNLPGIGEWTAQYIALRALAWPDAFPHGDLGIRRALGETDPHRVLARSEAWRPWRAYAAMHLWKSLEASSCLSNDPSLAQRQIA